MQKHYRAYVRLVLGLVGVITLLIVGTLYWGDPYGLYQRRDLMGLEGQDRLVKPHWLADSAPSVLLVGSSRAQLMLDPALVTSLTGKSAFNASLSGANIYEVRRMIDHAFGLQGTGDDENSGPEMVIIGLDFYMFNENRPASAGFSEDRLSRTANGQINRFHSLADLPATLLSRDALDELRRRLKYRDRPCQAIWSPDGGRRPHDYECALVRENGQQQSVSASLREYMGNTGGLYGDYPKAGSDMEDLRHILNASPQGTELVLYIAPVHLLHLEMIEMMGLWPSFKDWKRDLVSLVEVARTKGITVELWDFARASAWTQESVFSKDQGVTANFYDSHHLHQRHRQHFLEILLGRREPRAGEAVRLSAATFDMSEDTLAAAVETWAATHPEDMTRLRALYAESRP